MTVERWKPLDATLNNVEGARSPERYREVVRQFNVDANERYRPTLGQTWCNIFLWDVTRAMGCEVPHWVDRDGEPVSQGHGYELTANGVFRWLRKKGPARGWFEVPGPEAELRAALGHPTLAAWLNDWGHGHLAVVLPSRSGLRIAQAGRRCFFDEPLAEGFGTHHPVFFFHP